jgi:hypothetical protein
MPHLSESRRCTPQSSELRMEGVSGVWGTAPRDLRHACTQLLKFQNAWGCTKQQVDQVRGGSAFRPSSACLVLPRMNFPSDPRSPCSLLGTA